jgi:acetyl esterase/lipase
MAGSGVSDLNMKKQNVARVAHTFYLLCLVAALLGTACSQKKTREKQVSQEKKAAPPPPVESFTTSREYTSFGAEHYAAWQAQVPEVKNIGLPSSIDGHVDSVLFYTSASRKKKPLLVVLHSWSTTYLQQASIPFALWAMEKDWVFVSPNYRGIFDHPEAMASDLALQDIMDAVAYAKKQAHVDTTRIYVVGSSGGAMTALVAAGKHPDTWAGVMAWVPVFDIAAWYKWNSYFPIRKYNGQMEAALGGNPLTNAKAAAEARRRSPVTYISGAREVPIFLAHGILDELVQPEHSIRAFNMLAKPKDRITPWQIKYILKHKALPGDLVGATDSTYFRKTDPKVVFIRESNNVRLVLFEGVHDMVYNPGLLWLEQQQRRPAGQR